MNFVQFSIKFVKVLCTSPLKFLEQTGHNIIRAKCRALEIKEKCRKSLAWID